MNSRVIQCPGELHTRTSPAMRPVVGAWAAATPMEPTALAARQPATRPIGTTPRCMGGPYHRSCPRGNDAAGQTGWTLSMSAVRRRSGQLCAGALHDLAHAQALNPSRSGSGADGAPITLLFELTRLIRSEDLSFAVAAFTVP